MECLLARRDWSKQNSDDYLISNSPAGLITTNLAGNISYENKTLLEVCHFNFCFTQHWYFQAQPVRARPSTAEQDWCSLEPEDHSLKRLSHTGSRVSKKEKIYFKSSPDANIHHNHASSSSSSSVSKTPAMSFKSPEPSTLSRPLLFAQCNKEAEVTEKTSFQ